MPLFLSVAVSVVFPLKADLLTVEGNETVIREGDAMGVAPEIAEHLHRSAERRFGVTPSVADAGAEEVWPTAWDRGRYVRVTAA